MKKFNKTLAIAFFAVVSAFSFQSASAATSSEMDSDPEACILLASETNNEVSFANCIGPEWSSVDKLIENHDARVIIVTVGYELYKERKAGELTEERKSWYLLWLRGFDCPEEVIEILFTA